ncbi:MAG: hypothetical protein C4589_00400 [Peptococcaceae bacterium]|nr:MAG: hypothetical protein C4589_00400 [Peptococcaceae bacterium]
MEGGFVGKKYLLAAEADKIQDFIFRSARLREVAGGSMLLDRFCREVKKGLLSKKERPPEIVISDGGSFRLIFDNEADALAFGEELAEVYRLAAGGSLSVAGPVAYEEKDEFLQANKEAEKKLREAKRCRRGWQNTEQFPFLAYCSSCGSGLAKEYASSHDNERPAYLCASCLAKSNERPLQKGEDFWGRFAMAIGVSEPNCVWPGQEKYRGRTECDPLEDIADYDPRRYVAYLLADGNDLGRLFGKCTTTEQMLTLSDGLEEVMWSALASPARMAMKYPPDKRDGFIPVYPLLLGGDDLFALIPAPWALDFAAQFCREYEAGMQELLRRTGLPSLNGVMKPTVTAVVVICKSNYPYTQAHRAGEALLKKAKQSSKMQAMEKDDNFSAVDFEVITGSRMFKDEEEKKRIRPTLRPYRAGNNGTPEEWGKPVDLLIEQRKELISIPRRRLSQLNELYEEQLLPEALQESELKPWRDRLGALLSRLVRQEELRAKVLNALKAMGDEEKNGYWFRVDRIDGESWHGHAMPDLLRIWDFALDLKVDPDDYEEE